MRKVAVFVCLSLIGVALLPLLTVRLAPSGTLPQITVFYSMPSHSSITIEKEVTARLEAAIERVRGICQVRSVTDNGNGCIYISIDRNSDANAVRFEIATRVRQLWGYLPEGLSYPQITITNADNRASRPFLVYSIDAPVPTSEIEEYAENNILPALSRIKGVEKVDVSGATSLMTQYKYDNQQISALGIKEHQLAEAIKLSNNGVITSNSQIVCLDKLLTKEIIEDTPTSYFRINGQPSVFLSIMADKAANQLVVGNHVKELMEALTEKLPENYQLRIAYDATEEIDKQLEMVVNRSWLTVIILLVFVFFVYRSLRDTLMMAICLIVNLLLSAILYYIIGIEIHIYSLVGITISLNLIIDNMIVMADSIKRKGHQVYSAELTATLTTIGSVCVIFFLSEEEKMALYDYAWVIIINLACSLAVAFGLVPPLMKMMRQRISNTSDKKTKLLVLKARYSKYYEVFIRWLLPKRIFAFVLMGLFLASSIWVFIQEVKEGSYFNNQERETVLYASASLPNGATLEEMNSIIKKMESFLCSFEEISVFETDIYDARHATIGIHFKPQYRHGGFPYTLKGRIIAKALTIGGGAWSVYGLQDQGFSNDVREAAGNFEIKMEGYNYNELCNHANRMRDTLMLRKRIKDVNIAAEYSPWKEDYNEYILSLDNYRMAQLGLTTAQFFSQVSPLFIHSIDIRKEDGSVFRLKSKQGELLDVWALMNLPIETGNGIYKVSDVAVLEKHRVPQRIIKVNQQYQLILQYEYIGSYEQGRKFREEDIRRFKSTLPMGYSVEVENSWRQWPSENKETYLMVGLAVLIIWFILTVSLNSFLQPFAIIFLIPISMMGVFVSFWLFEMKLDEGFLASLIFLSGITVNSGIFLISEYRFIQKEKPLLPCVVVYKKALNHKIIPILLTQFSTVLGFTPFVIGSLESFWFNMAVSIISGVIMSIIGILFFLPLLLLSNKKSEYYG